MSPSCTVGAWLPNPTGNATGRERTPLGFWVASCRHLRCVDKISAGLGEQEELGIDEHSGCGAASRHHGLLKHKDQIKAPCPLPVRAALCSPGPRFCPCVLPASSGPAGTLLSPGGAGASGQDTEGDTWRMALGTATTSIPSSHPPSPRTLGQSRGAELLVCERCTQPTPKPCLVLPGQGGCGYASWLFPIDFSHLAASKKAPLSCCCNYGRN